MLKSLIKNVAFSAGVTLTRQIKGADVLDLIAKLRPQDCGRDLIRIGGDADGGYLIPDDLKGIEYCFSPGVGASVSFESHLATLNIKSFLADYSVDSPPFHRPEFTFDRKSVSANESQTSFTLTSWKDKYLRDYTGELLLQMDVEGSEYEVLINTSNDVLRTFRIM